MRSGELTAGNDTGGAAQVAAAHCPNERTLDPAVCSYAPASRTMAFTPQCKVDEKVFISDIMTTVSESLVMKSYNPYMMYRNCEIKYCIQAPVDNFLFRHIYLRSGKLWTSTMRAFSTTL